LTPALAFAQGEEYHRNNITVGIGAAIPTGSATSYLSTAPLVSVGYGYRFSRLLQAVAGVQFAFGAANNSNIEQTDLGTVQGGDREYMVPLGGRLYVPTPLKRIEFAVGGGRHVLALLGACFQSRHRFFEHVLHVHIARRGGYGLASARYYLDSNHNFHIGTTYQFISATTNGQAVGDLPANSTRDHWSNIAVEFGFSF